MSVFEPMPGLNYGSDPNKNLYATGASGALDTSMMGSGPVTSSELMFSNTAAAGQPLNAMKSGTFGGGSIWDTLGNTDKMRGVGTIMQGLGTLGQVWMGLQANKLAREQFDFQKKSYNTNLENQTHNYNSQVQDTADRRAVNLGDPSAADTYYNRHRLPA